MLILSRECHALKKALLHANDLLPRKPINLTYIHTLRANNNAWAIIGNPS